MIVLDEQMSNRRVLNAIGKWYRGKVLFAKDLRPGSIIKDDSIPQLLRQKKSKPAFVTINVSHFWRKAPTDQRFCVVCLDISDFFIRNMAPVLKLLNWLFSHPDFSKKKQRAGHVFRITADGLVQFYSHDDNRIRSLVLLEA